MPDADRSMNATQRDRLGELTFRYLDGELDDAGLAELNALMREFDEARSLFTAFGQERFVLRDLLTAAHEEADAASILQGLASLEDASADAELVDLAEELKGRRLRKLQAEQAKARFAARHQGAPAGPFALPKLAVVLAFAATLGLIAWLGWPDPAPPTRQAGQGRSAQADAQVEHVAQVRRSLDARWEGLAYDSERRLAEGKAVTLRAGLAEVVFTDGASVVVQGPATFVPTGTNGLRLETGRIVASVPPAAIGFTVDTPTARIIDYGTEFAVHADGGAATQVQVFQGEVRAAARVDGAVVGAAVPLFVDEAATVASGSGVVERTVFEPVAYERRVVERLDVLDIVAGGDGRGSRRGSGIDPQTGRRVSSFSHPQSQPAVARPRYRSVAGSPIIDGVFVAADAVSLDVIDSAGHRPGFLHETGRQFLGPIWAMPMSEVGSGNEYTQWAGAIQTPELFAPRGHGLLVMHSNAGITFDLQAATRGTDLATTRFTATAANAESNGGVNPTAHPSSSARKIACSIYVVVDGEVRFQREGFNSTDGVFDLDVPLDPSDRYLTLIVTDTDGNYGYDWAVLGDPFIELSPSMVDGG